MTRKRSTIKVTELVDSTCEFCRRVQAAWFSMWFSKWICEKCSDKETAKVWEKKHA